jgi:hypothetical protein
MIAVAVELRPVKVQVDLLLNLRMLGDENGFALKALPLPDQQDFGSINDKPLAANRFRRLGQRRLDK